MFVTTDFTTQESMKKRKLFCHLLSNNRQKKMY